jgi:hypothetical protein
VILEMPRPTLPATGVTKPILPESSCEQEKFQVNIYFQKSNRYDRPRQPPSEGAAKKPDQSAQRAHRPALPVCINL